MVDYPTGFVGDVGRERQMLRSKWLDRGLLSPLSIPAAIAANIPVNKGFLAIHSDGDLIETSARALHDEAVQLALALHAFGIEPGDIVAFQLPNLTEATSLLLAIIYAGAVALPIVPIFGRREVEFILRQSGASAMFIADTWNNVDYIDHLDQIDALPALKLRVALGSRVPLGGILWADFRSANRAGSTLPKSQPEDICLVLYTSGTTSDPKGVMHSHQTVQAAMANMVSPTKRDEVYRALTSPSTGHIGHVMQALLVVMMGAEVASMARWSPNVAAMLIERYRLVRMDGAPIFLHSLLTAARTDGRDISSLTDVKIGGTAIMPSDVLAWQGLGISAFRAYGSTEHPLATTSWAHDPIGIRANTDGYASPGTRIQILKSEGLVAGTGEAGEILMLGPQQFVGYFDQELNADHFMSDGWFLTGDIGVLNADGGLTITDRKKDIIIRGGENISAKEVEDALAVLPWILECAAVSMPDPRLGEKVCLFATVSDPSQATLENIGNHLRDLGIAKQKTPERLILVDSFPRTASGKIKKYELRAQVRENMPDSIAWDAAE